MKKTLGLLLFIGFINAQAVTAIPNAHLISQTTPNNGGALVTSNAALTITLINAPVVGIFLLVDGESVQLDLSNQDTLDLIEEIQYNIADGIELNEIQEAILTTGVSNNQLDSNAKIIQ